MTVKALLLHCDDNIATALVDLHPGQFVEISENTGQTVSICLHAQIPLLHKFAVAEIRKRESIIKSGYPIGVAGCDIHPGDLVHTNNLVDQVNDHDR
jgi:altronate hydrolase